MHFLKGCLPSERNLLQNINICFQAACKLTLTFPEDVYGVSSFGREEEEGRMGEGGSSRRKSF